MLTHVRFQGGSAGVWCGGVEEGGGHDGGRVGGVAGMNDTDGECGCGPVAWTIRPGGGGVGMCRRDSNGDKECTHLCMDHTLQGTACTEHDTVRSQSCTKASQTAAIQYMVHSSKSTRYHVNCQTCSPVLNSNKSSR